MAAFLPGMKAIVKIVVISERSQREWTLRENLVVEQGSSPFRWTAVYVLLNPGALE